MPLKKLSDRIVKQIEHWIESGEVNPGDKLPSVRELCELFDVGRSAVRDAITTLKGKGLVNVKHGEGTFICHFDLSTLFHGLLLADEKDISQLFGVRKVLEVGIAENAAIHHRTQNLKEMKDAIEKLQSVETMKAWESDYDFHIAIAKATQNEMLVQLMQTISASTQKAMMDCHLIILSDVQLTKTVFEQHLAIYKAIKGGLAQEARERMFLHLTFVEGLLHRSAKR